MTIPQLCPNSSGRHLQDTRDSSRRYARHACWRASLCPHPCASSFHPLIFPTFLPSRRGSPLAPPSLSCERELLLSNDTARRTGNRESRTFLLDPRIIMSLSSLGIIYRDWGARPCRVNLSTGVLAFRTMRCGAPRSISGTRVKSIIGNHKSRGCDQKPCMLLRSSVSRRYKNYYTFKLLLHMSLHNFTNLFQQ